MAKEPPGTVQPRKSRTSLDTLSGTSRQRHLTEWDAIGGAPHAVFVRTGEPVQPPDEVQPLKWLDGGWPGDSPGVQEGAVDQHCGRSGDPM